VNASRRGVPPPTVHLFGAPFTTWRGVPLIPSNKLEVKNNATRILLLRVGEVEQGVVGLQKTGVTGEVEPGLSVRYMGTNENSIGLASRHPLLFRHGADHDCHRAPEKTSL